MKEMEKKNWKRGSGAQRVQKKEKRREEDKRK